MHPEFSGGGRRTRTLDLRLRRPLLYPAELYPQVFGGTFDGTFRVSMFRDDKARREYTLSGGIWSIQATSGRHH